MMRRRKSCTIHDVARLAQVSVATVSALTNSSAFVSEALAERIRNAMAVLDYHPDRVARSLRTGKTHAIGMVVPDVTNPFYPEVIRGVEQAAQQNGYSLVLVNSNENPEQERSGLETLMALRVDGLLIACCDGAATTYDVLARRNIPTVFVDRIPAQASTIRVATDNFKAGLVATKHLIDLGHKRIAIVAGRMELSPHAARVEGFRKAMQEAGLAVLDDYFRTGSLSVESGYRMGKKLLALECRPTAIFCTNNKSLLGLVRAVGEQKIACPAELSVIGFDDFAWTENFHPQLTTIVQSAQELGRRGTGILIERIMMRDGTHPTEPIPAEPLLIEAQLQIRQSTAPPPGSATPRTP